MIFVMVNPPKKTEPKMAAAKETDFSSLIF